MRSLRPAPSLSVMRTTGVTRVGLSRPRERSAGGEIVRRQIVL